MSYPVYTVYSGDVLPIFFDSFDGGTGASITMTGLAVTDIEIYKDGGTTQRASDAGYTLLDTDGIDVDGITGIHGFSIDTGDNTDAGFYAVGSWYHVVVSSVTIDSQTVNFVAAAFRIVAAEAVAGVPVVDVKAISGDSTAADNCELMFDGTGYAGGSTKLVTDAVLNATQGSYAPAKAGDAMTLADDAITAGKFDESTAFPVKSADTGATAIARAGADSDTLETLSDQIDGAALEATLTAIKGAGWSTETLAAIDALIDAVKAKSDLIPASPAAVGSAMTLTAAYDAAKSAAPAGAAMTLTAAYDLAKTAAQTSDITTAHATTDGKIDAVDNYVDTEISTIISTLATIQGYVDDLESRLTAARAGYLDLINTNLDAAISTRAAAATALSSATWTNTKAGYIDAAISSVGGGAAPTVEQIRAEMDSNSTKLALLSNGTYGLSALKTLVDAITGYVDDLETRLTATRAGYLDNLATAPPTAADIDTELSSSHGAGAWGAASTGSSTYTDTITDDDGDPLEDVQVEVYSDSDYTTLVAVEETNVNGAFTFSLNPGTYYVRCIKSGYTFTDFSKVVT